MSYTYRRVRPIVVAAKKTLDLSHYDLEGLQTGQAVTLYHGTTKLFKTFDISKSRTELVDKYYGAGIFLTPSKRVAWKYARATRNEGLDPEVVEDMKRVHAGAGRLLEQLYTEGRDAWDHYNPEALGVIPEDFRDAMRELLGGRDANTIADISRYILGSKTLSENSDEGAVDLFSTSTGLPDWVFDQLDEVGIDSQKYRPKVYTCHVTVSNPLVTASKSAAKSAKSKGYDSVVFYGPDLVEGVPEVAVFRAQDVKISNVETLDVFKAFIVCPANSDFVAVQCDSQGCTIYVSMKCNSCIDRDVAYFLP